MVKSMAIPLKYTGLFGVLYWALDWSLWWPSEA